MEYSQWLLYAYLEEKLLSQAGVKERVTFCSIYFALKCCKMTDDVKGHSTKFVVLQFHFNNFYRTIRDRITVRYIPYVLQGVADT